MDILQKISELNTMSGEELPDAMKQLKRALMENPDAVALMRDEDIGEMVAALRRITGQEIVAAPAKKSGGKAKAKTLTQQEILDAMNEL